ncbi:hypothetical protein AV530_001222 [Patagioenas fasciata monilis]|uniref:Uncharacterized protein n=1 Tax=Patagioenas fasciata monilis TaxID=372326 RepID=A0A1V4JQM9_PATFA|nr:hypothetical protein AV530_001222 [Patagioenas fasciata monilis]
MFTILPPATSVRWTEADGMNSDIQREHDRDVSKTLQAVLATPGNASSTYSPTLRRMFGFFRLNSCPWYQEKIISKGIQRGKKKRITVLWRGSAERSNKQIGSSLC